MSIAKIYVNGILTGSTSVSNKLPWNVIRRYNYAGCTSWEDADSTACIDDLRIYKRALSLTEINALMYEYPS